MTNLLLFSIFVLECFLHPSDKTPKDPIKSILVAGYRHIEIDFCIVLYDIGNHFRAKFSILSYCDAGGRSLLLGDGLKIAT